MKTNLGTGYIIEGFNTLKEVVREQIGRDKTKEFRETLYEGKTSEIPEEIAKECVELTSTGLYKSYMWNDDKVEEHGIQPLSNTAKESIQSACNQTYCIIYKEK